ncbi:MAG: HAMP domain-containing histidine kinase, partial [Anaerolineae bacterium]|nr:HAMP domain-containing histidine kinase [Anaerolineae bacterium]
DLDAFAHTVAHDLKGPLSNIFGYASVLEQELPPDADETLSDGITVIARSAQRMGNIIDALLLLAGLRGAEVELEVVDMGSVVDDVLQRLAYVVTNYDAQVVLPERWPEAVGYGPWIEEVWANYISNALKYGGTPPVVELGAETMPEGMIRFWARDNGAGMTEEEQAQLFAPFTRLAQVKVQGHGLGLSIVHRIIDRLGGDVGVRSTPNQGSEFYFCLPDSRYEVQSL